MLVLGSVPYGFLLIKHPLSNLSPSFVRQTREVRASVQRARAERDGCHDTSKPENAKQCIETWTMQLSGWSCLMLFIVFTAHFFFV